MISITLALLFCCFLGITGTVSIDENGDRNADYSLLDLNPKTGDFEVGCFHHLTHISVFGLVNNDTFTIYVYIPRGYNLAASQAI